MLHVMQVQISYNFPFFLVLHRGCLKETSSAVTKYNSFGLVSSTQSVMHRVIFPLVIILIASVPSHCKGLQNIQGYLSM